MTLIRTYKTKGMGTRNATPAMAFKMIKEAEKGWHRIAGCKQLGLVRERRVFKDGELAEQSAAYEAMRRDAQPPKVTVRQKELVFF